MSDDIDITTSLVGQETTDVIADESVGDNTGDEDSSPETDTFGEYRYKDFTRIDSIDTHRGANIPKPTIICLLSCHKRILLQRQSMTHSKRTSLNTSSSNALICGNTMKTPTITV